MRCGSVIYSRARSWLETDKNKNVHFGFSVYDTYQWYLDVGPNKTLDDKYLHGSVAAWNSVMAHPDYDDFWKRQAWIRQLHSSPVPNLNVAGFWDQEDPWGPWQIFAHSAESDPNHNNYMVAGPWFHGQWQKPNAESIGSYDYGGHDTAREFRHDIEAPFFRYFLHGEGERPTWRIKTFRVRIEHLADLRKMAAGWIGGRQNCICGPMAH